MLEKSNVVVRPFKLALLASLALAAAGASTGAIAATATAAASASVVAPISITSSGSLAFGKFAAGTSAGTVTISTAGTRTVSGVTASGGTTGAASFQVNGDASTGYTIDTSATTATLASGANTMALALVTDFTGGGAITGAQSSGTLDGTGKQTLYVGGILSVGANQPAGAYSGTVSVAVAYQ
jgi:spore coat protein U-like protein